LRHRAFRLFLGGRIVSLLGNSMAPLALAFAVLRYSQGAGDLGLVLGAQGLSLVLFTSIGGVVGDRYSRNQVLIASNLAASATQAVTALVLISGHYSLPLVAGLAFLGGTCSAFTTPALRGIVPQLVEPSEIQRANSLLGSSRNAIRIGGPTVAGLIVASVGGGWAIAADAVAYLLAAWFMARLRLEPAPMPRSSSVWTDLREGWVAFTSMTWVWVGVLAYGVTNCIQVGIWSVLGPAIAFATFGPALWGVVLGIRAGGQLIMSALMYRVRVTRLLLFGQVGLAVAGIPLIVIGLQLDVYWLMIAALVSGLGGGVAVIAWDTSLQEHVPTDRLSRIASYDDIGSYVGIPIGRVLVGPASVALGDARTALAGGIVYMAAALLPCAIRSVRELRHDDSASG
jgi:MFS family permease